MFRRCRAPKLLLAHDRCQRHQPLIGRQRKFRAESVREGIADVGIDELSRLPKDNAGIGGDAKAARTYSTIAVGAAVTLP